MTPTRKPTIDEIIKKHSARIEQSIRSEPVNEKVNYSQSYLTFKDEMAPELSRYERWCKTIGNIIKLKASEKDREKTRVSLEIAHLDLEPWQPITLSVVAFIVVFIAGILISVSIALFKGGFQDFPLSFLVLVMFFGMFLFYFLNGYPARLANKWRLKASSQMMPAILYIVVYMRHTPNLEKAISFASEHLQYPLSLDFKKIFYDVQIGKFSTIKESLDNYLNGWKDYSVEFIEAFHLIESSLYEAEDAKRVLTLEKALQVVLDGVYDKMLRFTHEVRSPLTNVYMLGVVLPTLGLALLPLASAMVGDYIKWYHVFVLFNLIIPFFVFYLTDKVMFLRPGGYGETNLLERNPNYPLYKSKVPYVRSFLICLPLFIIGLLPLLFQTQLPTYFGLQQDYTFKELGLVFFGDGSIFDFRVINGKTTGPFGIGALLMGVFFILGVALFFSLAFKERTKELIKEREKTKQLEVEFNNSLFQLGNRIGDGVPPELAFSKIAESTKGLRTEDFFRRVSYNITQMGMSVESAIFDSKRGVLVYYPSDLIATSMKILVESAKKGLHIAALSLISLSEYVKNMNKITDRLRDLLAEIISDMKSNMTFLAPLLSGIVIGLAAMITNILTRLDVAQLSGDTGSIAGFGNLTTILSMFDIAKMIPPYTLQIIVGLYLIEVIFILTGTLVVIDSGEDRLEQTNKTGSNLKKGIGLYVVTAFLAIVALFLLTSIVLGNLGS
jgi:Flp pilus assembly protein TadB